MKCSKCRKGNSPGAAYCFWCGDRLGDEVRMFRQPASQPDELQDVKQRLRQMSLRLSALERQVKGISRGMSIGESVYTLGDKTKTILRMIFWGET